MDGTKMKERFMKKVLSLVVILTLIITSCLFSAQAAGKVKLNKKKATIKVGQIVKLKVKNTKKKAKWSSSNKQVATVNKKGKVTGKKAGKATITAKVGKKKYRCIVRVITSTIPNNAVQKPTEKPTEPTTTKPEETTEPVDPNDWDYEYLEDGTVMITEYKGTKTKVTFPSEIDGYKVTEISGSSKLSEIITWEEDGSGYRKRISKAYNSLKEITVPASIMYIRDGAFKGCECLEKVVLPPNLTYISSEVFYDCPKLVSIEIPEGVTSIGSEAFLRCNSLENIRIPNGVTSIGESAFEGCSSLVNINLPNGITKIEDATFEDCTSLSEIIMPEKVNHIGSNGGSWDSGRGAFRGCYSLKSVKLPSRLKSIGDYSFCECTNLREISIPNVKIIGNGAFEDSGLLAVDIPNSVETIGEGAFAYCKALKAITVPGGVQKITDPYSEGGHYGTGVFEGCTALTDATIEYGVEHLGINCFRKCSELTNVSIPNSVKSIEGGAFYECPKLNSVFIPKSVSFIEYVEDNSEDPLWDSDYSLMSSFDKTITLKGKLGSYVQEFANKNGYNFLATN